MITPSGTSSTSSADHFAYATPATLWVFSGAVDNSRHALQRHRDVVFQQ